MTEKYQVQTVDNYTETIVLIAANLWEKSNISTVEEHNWEDLVWIHNSVNLQGILNIFNANNNGDIMRHNQLLAIQRQ